MIFHDSDRTKCWEGYFLFSCGSGCLVVHHRLFFAYFGVLCRHPLTGVPCFVFLTGRGISPSPREFVLNFSLMINRFLLESRPMSPLFKWHNFSLQLLGKVLFKRKHYSTSAYCFVALAMISFDVYKRCSCPLFINLVRES